MVQEESTVIPERATDPLTGKESFIFRMPDHPGASRKGNPAVSAESHPACGPAEPLPA
jgi:hypothetical protein